MEKCRSIVRKSKEKHNRINKKKYRTIQSNVRALNPIKIETLVDFLVMFSYHLQNGLVTYFLFSFSPSLSHFIFLLWKHRIQFWWFQLFVHVYQRHDYRVISSKNKIRFSDIFVIWTTKISTGYPIHLWYLTVHFWFCFFFSQFVYENKIRRCTKEKVFFQHADLKKNFWISSINWT